MTALRWTAHDSLVLTRRYLTHWVAQPAQILFGLAFAIVSVVLFGFVFGSAMQVPGGGDYREFLMPGLFVMTMAFGTAETMVAINTDVTRGVTDRFRSMPMARSAVVVGRSIADLLYSILNLAVLLATGLAVGWRWHGSLGQALAAIALLLLLRFALLWIGLLLGLWVPNPEAAGAVWGLLYPATMLSNAFAAPELMPGWLGAIAAWNPLSATVTATRDLFGNPGAQGDPGWVGDHALALAVAWPLVIVVVFLPLAARRYQALSR